MATTIRGTTAGILVYTMDSNYDALGRRTGLVLGGSATGSITYNYSPTTFRFTGLTGFGGGATTISYNDDGLPLSTALPGGVQVTQTYTSNHLPQETSFSITALNTAAGVLYAYDPLNRIARRTQGDGLKKRVYGYDANGRWLANFRDSAVVGTTRPTCSFDPNLGYVCNDPTVQWQQTYTESYTYDLNGNPTNQGAVQGAGDRLNQFNGYTLEHDADGNVTRKYKSGYDQYLYWNALGQLDSVKTNGQTTRYHYDGFGRRMRMITPAGVATLYVYDGDDLLLELDAAGAVVAKYTYYPGVDDPHSVVRGGTTYYYGTDQQGSVLALFNGAGQVVNSYKYLPFGEAESATETVANPLRYTAREFEAATGLYYYRNRWYDPALHRFLSQDPIGIAGGVNLYAYVGNDPANYVDPYGLYQCYIITFWSLMIERENGQIVRSYIRPGRRILFCEGTSAAAAPANRRSGSRNGVAHPSRGVILHDRCAVAKLLRDYVSALRSNPSDFSDGTFPARFDFKFNTEGELSTDLYRAGNQWLRANQFGNFAASYAAYSVAGLIGVAGVTVVGINYASGPDSDEHWSDYESWPMIAAGANRAAYEGGNNGAPIAMRGLIFGTRPYVRPLTSTEGCN